MFFWVVKCFMLNLIFVWVNLLLWLIVFSIYEGFRFVDVYVDFEDIVILFKFIIKFLLFIFVKFIFKIFGICCVVCLFK